MENRRFAPPGGSVGVPSEPNLESLRAPSVLKVEDLRSSDRRDSLAKRTLLAKMSESLRSEGFTKPLGKANPRLSADDDSFSVFSCSVVLSNASSGGEGFA